MTRDQRAIQLRDAALALLRRSGKWHHYASYSLLTYQNDELKIIYRTPLLRWSEKTGPDDREIKQYGPYTASQLPQHSNKSLPYTLNVWWGGRRKVLNIEWADDGPVEFGTYKPGAWEKFLMAGRA